MDGEATSIALKKINPRLKIIMASGSVPGKHGREAAAHGNFISAFVPKPYTVDRLLTVVHEVLAQK
jgi:CheY-like chemotaxis protein